MESFLFIVGILFLLAICHFDPLGRIRQFNSDDMAEGQVREQGVSEEEVDDMVEEQTKEKSDHTKAVELIKEVVSKDEVFVNDYGGTWCIFCFEESKHAKDCWFKRAKKLIEEI